MEIQSYLENKIDIQEQILNYIENENNSQQIFQDLMVSFWKIGCQASQFFENIQIKYIYMLYIIQQFYLIKIGYLGLTIFSIYTF